MYRLGNLENVKLDGNGKTFSKSVNIITAFKEEKWDVLKKNEQFKENGDLCQLTEKVIFCEL